LRHFDESVYAEFDNSFMHSSKSELLTLWETGQRGEEAQPS